MGTAKVFLSHNSSDKPLVEKVADALSRLGIIPWLDINMMSPGISLTLQLKEAIHNQTAIALFLSKKAASSKWVQEELTEAIRLYCDLPFNVIPILSANLVHVMDNVEFMEYRRDLLGKNPGPQDMYTSLPMID
ncbi:MAG: toll/interleukin-1 receptor domain-containing protein [Candidatus Aminicenantes bacterium]|nr:toll/interleukin-1 receptor domain-containing protein [Candidatus Aminicenantes bacterium]